MAAELSSRIVGAMTTPIDHDSGPLEVGVSVGFALSSEAGSPAELVDLADRSMYRHKARRRADAG